MIGIAFASKKVKKIFDKNPKVIFIDNKGFWGFFDNSSERILLPNIKNNFIENFNVCVARNYLNSYMPLWTRYIPHANQYEKKREEALVSIYNIFVMLNNYKINSVIFHTGVPHGINDSLLSIACCLKKIKQIYLYSQIIDQTRLLPILQSDDIKTRTPLDINVSSFEFKKSINKFLNRKMRDLMPEELIGTKNKGLLQAIIFLLRREIFFLRIKIVKIIKRIIFRKKEIVGGGLDSKNISSIIPHNIDKYSFFEDLINIINQILYLKALSKETISDQELNILRSSDKPKLIIAAHFQPEATSFPEGGDYYSHIDIAFAIRNKKYKDQIFYKEHLGTFEYFCRIVGLLKVGINRSPVYLKLLKDLGCKFLPSNYNFSIKKDHNWYVPITITGSIAIERSLAGLHTIYAGVPWYKGLPGTIYINDIKSLKEIPAKWAKFNPLIQRKAKIFLENKLNNKTIVNISGIGTGVYDHTQKSEKNFKLAMLKIIKWLSKNKY